MIIVVFKNTFDFSIDKIDISGIRPSRLANVGLLSAILSSNNGTEVITINMVVQVTKSVQSADEGDGIGERRTRRQNVLTCSLWGLRPPGTPLLPTAIPYPSNPVMPSDLNQSLNTRGLLDPLF